MEDSTLSNLPIWLPPLYLPPVGFMAVCKTAKQLNFSSALPMAKRSLQTRAHIKCPQGVLRLTVPVDHASRKHGMSATKILYEKPWQRDHVRSIQNYYRTAAFFEYYWPELEHLFSRDFTFLHELNWALLEKILRCLRIGFVSFIDRAEGLPLPTPRVPAWSLEAGAAPQEMGFPPYYQLFGAFMPNISILDLLFHEGPAAGEYLTRCAKRLPNINF